MVSRFAALTLGLGTSVIALTAYAQNAATTAPITDIRLSSGGLAEIRRQVEVKDNSAVNLTVPLNQVDDVLKSLKVNDPKGTASSASLAGKEPLAEVFRNLPFSPADLSTQSSLMAALQGAAVTVSGNGRETKGRIVGVETTRVQDKNGETAEVHRLTVFSGGKLTAFDLDKVDVTLDDPTLRAKLESGLNAVQAAKAGDARDIAVSLNGSGPRNVAIDYVVPAPIWKATYRLVLPKEGNKAGIQGWAVIENNSSDDWKNVRLSLSSGNPVTLYQRLYESYYAKRPEIPVYGPNGIVPLTDKGGDVLAQMEAKEEAADMEYAADRKMRTAPAPIAAQIARDDRQRSLGASGMSGQIKNAPPPAEVTESDISTVYDLPNPVNLSSGQSLTVRFLENGITADRVSVFQPQLGIQNPVAAVVINNQSASSLPPGILTLSEDGSGYVGDAQLAGLPAGETRMVMFATDRKVVIGTNTTGSQKIAKVAYDGGVLKADLATETNVTYKIKGAQDGDRTVIVEYPRRQGFTYTSAQKDSETPTAIRLKVNVPKGGTAEAQISEQRVLASSYSLADIENDGGRMAVWASQASTDPKLVAKIKDAAEALAKVNEAKQVLGSYDGEVDQIRSDQERIRENLQAVPATSDLAKTYLANMSAQEKRLTEITALRAKGEENLKGARAELSSKIKAF